MNDSNLSDQERRKIHDWERALLQDIKESAVDLADLQSDKFDRATDDLDALYQGVCYPREGNLDGLCLDELDSAVGGRQLGYLTVVMTLYFKASELITASGNAYVNNSEFDWEALGNAVGSCFQSVVKKEKKKPRRVLQDKKRKKPNRACILQRFGKEDIQDAQARRLGILETAIKRESGQRVSFFDVVLDSSSFEQTVENLFDASFLVHNGSLGIGLDDTTGLPFLGKERSLYVLN
ncbi:Nse4/EID family [Phytophthora cactorum]|nr:Nse4/EID family [Phytophthora cactorum]